MGDDGVAVSDVGPLHRDEDDVGVVAVNQEVGGVREQRVVCARVDVGGGGPRLADREADEVASLADAFGLECSRGESRWFEQEGRVGNQMNVLRDADVLE